MFLEQIDQQGDLVAYKRGSDLEGAKKREAIPTFEAHLSVKTLPWLPCIVGLKPAAYFPSR